MANPLISVTIPTKNSEETISFCLQSIKEQSYPDIEIVVVDSFSSDKTRMIAESYGAKIVLCKGGLLEARFLGVESSRGEYVVLVDSDQILEKTAIERALKLVEEKSYDMVIFEEQTWPLSKGFIAKLYKASRQIINLRITDPEAIKPGVGFFLPRFFKRKLLEEAFKAIPKNIMPKIIHYDHDIIYYECYKLSQKVGILRNGIYHIEPSIGKLLKTNLRYGASLKIFSRLGYYKDLVKKGESRIYLGRPLWVGLQSLTLSLLLKTIQRLGYLLPIQSS